MKPIGVRSEATHGRSRSASLADRPLHRSDEKEDECRVVM